MVAGPEMARKIFSSPQWMPHSVKEMRPAPNRNTDEELADYAKTGGASVFHPKSAPAPHGVASRRVGRRSRACACARRFRIAGHRCVGDADGTTGNTNAPTIMIAEKGAAKLILEDARASG